MTEWHLKSRTKRTGSGGRNKALRRCDKKLAWRGGDFPNTTIGENEVINVRTRGGNSKQKTKLAKTISVVDPETNQVEQGEIITVRENNANRLYVRRNIMTKGAIVKVKLKKGEKYAKITTRPGQAGGIQGVLTEYKEEKHKTQETPVKEQKTTEKELNDEMTVALPEKQ